MNIIKSQSKIRAIGFSLATIIVYLTNSILVGVFYGALLGTGIIGDGADIGTYIDNNSISILAGTSILSIITFGIILYFKQKNSRNYSDRPFVSFITKIEKKKFIESLILIFGVLGLTFLWVTIIGILSEGNLFYKGLLESHDSIMGGLVDTESLLGMFIIVAIIVPITEELFFRGLIYGRLRQAMPIIVANIISSAIFGIFHGNIVQGIYAFFIGFIHAIIYEKTDSLLLSIFGHGLLNFIGAVLPSIATTFPYLKFDKLHLALVILSCIALIPSIIILRKWYVEGKEGMEYPVL